MVKTTIVPSGEVLATDVTFEEFLTQFDGQFVEWLNGKVVSMPPETVQHNQMTGFLIAFFECVLAPISGGHTLHRPFVMRSKPDLPVRSPDIAIVLPNNFDLIKEYYLAGPADLVIEVVSPESHRRDRVEKFAEYEKGGVPEYWVLDPIRRETLFYVRNNDGLYQPVEPDENGIYRSHVLPQLHFAANIFWQIPLPRGPEITKLVEDMLKS